MSDEEREYLNEMIRNLNNQLVDALRERDEALEQLRLANIDAFNNEAEANELRKQTWDHGGAFGQFERDRE